MENKANYTNKVFSNDDRVIIGNVYTLRESLFKIVFDANKVDELPRQNDFKMFVKQKYVPKGYKLSDYRSKYYVYYNKSGVYPENDQYVQASLSLNTCVLCNDVPFERVVSQIGNIYDNITVFIKSAKNKKMPWNFNVFYFKDENVNKLFSNPNFHKNPHLFDNIRQSNHDEVNCYYENFDKKIYRNEHVTLGSMDNYTEEYIQYRKNLELNSDSPAVSSDVDNDFDCFDDFFAGDISSVSFYDEDCDNSKQKEPSFTQQPVEKEQIKSKHKISL